MQLPCQGVCVLQLFAQVAVWEISHAGLERGFAPPQTGAGI